MLNNEERVSHVQWKVTQSKVSDCQTGQQTKQRDLSSNQSSDLTASLVQLGQEGS